MVTKVQTQECGHDSLFKQEPRVTVVLSKKASNFKRLYSISMIKTGNMIPELSIPPIPIPILTVLILGTWEV